MIGEVSSYLSDQRLQCLIYPPTSFKLYIIISYQRIWSLISHPAYYQLCRLRRALHYLVSLNSHHKITPSFKNLPATNISTQTRDTASASSSLSSESKSVPSKLASGCCMKEDAWIEEPAVKPVRSFYLTYLLNPW